MQSTNRKIAEGIDQDRFVCEKAVAELNEVVDVICEYAHSFDAY